MPRRVTRLDYCQYLLSSQTHYTLTHMAEPIQGQSHDTLNRYLLGEKLKPRYVWEQVKKDIVVSDHEFLV